jgi:GcrA cell cycle regulator
MPDNRPTWSAERTERLKRCFQAGLTCSQIAREIGVTRNAVIGKMSRLGLSRPKDVLAQQLKRAGKLSRASTPSKTWRPRRARLNIFAQHEMLRAAFPEHEPRTTDVPIHNGTGCTLLELAHGKCRWPISSPGADDFCFCGNETVDGLSYCLGHARIAYRPASRERRSA